MQIAKEPLLYHLCGSRREAEKTYAGGAGGEGKGTRVLGWGIHRIR